MRRPGVAFWLASRRPLPDSPRPGRLGPRQLQISRQVLTRPKGTCARRARKSRCTSAPIWAYGRFTAWIARGLEDLAVSLSRVGRGRQFTRTRPPGRQKPPRFAASPSLDQKVALQVLDGGYRNFVRQSEPRGLRRRTKPRRSFSTQASSRSAANSTSRATPAPGLVRPRWCGTAAGNLAGSNSSAGYATAEVRPHRSRQFARAHANRPLAQP